MVTDVGSLRMGQRRCVGPHNSHPAAERHIPEKDDEVWVREPISHTRKVQSNPPWTHRGAATFAMQALCSDRQRAPSEPPHWVLSTWPEQDKEQYKQHMAQIQVPTHSTHVSPVPRAHPMMQRLAGKGCLGGYAEPKGRSGNLEEHLGHPDHPMHLT